MSASDLITDAELAERMRLDLDRFHALRKRHGWPCVKLGRFEFRFTEAQIEQIVAAHTVTPARRLKAKPVKGQTARSANRRRAS